MTQFLNVQTVKTQDNKEGVTWTGQSRGARVQVNGAEGLNKRKQSRQERFPWVATGISTNARARTHLMLPATLSHTKMTGRRKVNVYLPTHAHAHAWWTNWSRLRSAHGALLIIISHWYCVCACVPTPQVRFSWGGKGGGSLTHYTLHRGQGCKFYASYLSAPCANRRVM